MHTTETPRAALVDTLTDEQWRELERIGEYIEAIARLLLNPDDRESLVIDKTHVGVIKLLMQNLDAQWHRFMGYERTPIPMLEKGSDE